MLNKISKRRVVVPLASIWISILVMTSFSPALAHVAHKTGNGDEVVSEIKILWDDNFFQLEGGQVGVPIILKTGQRVEIEFENIGFAEHEIVFGKEVLFEKGKPLGYQENFFQGVEVEIKGGINGKGFNIGFLDLIYLVLEPEARLKVAFTVPGDKVGQWELGCFYSGHYEDGMHTSLLIED
jgi:uncharacterized cupredoxin-like copper-binding protein